MNWRHRASVRASGLSPERGTPRRAHHPVGLPDGVQGWPSICGLGGAAELRPSLPRATLPPLPDMKGDDDWKEEGT